MLKSIRHSLSKVISVIAGELELAIQNIRTKRKVRKVLAGGKDINLELGAGKNRKLSGWHTLDITDGMDFKWNLQYGIPFPDNSVTTIFSSHVFEHFHARQVQYLFSECFRVLKPGGCLLITVPNARLFLETYSKTGADMNKFWDKLYEPANWNTGSSLDIVNHIFYMGGDHRYMFDEESMLNILKMTGFKDVSLRDMDPLLDLELRAGVSLYAIGVKK